MGDGQGEEENKPRSFAFSRTKLAVDQVKSLITDPCH